MIPQTQRDVIEQSKALRENKRWTKEDDQREAIKQIWRHWPWRQSFKNDDDQSEQT